MKIFYDGLPTSKEIVATRWQFKLIDYSVYAEKKADDGSLELKLPENFSNDPSHLIQSQTEAESNVCE